MKKLRNNVKNSVNRRSFMKSGLLAGAATMGGGLLSDPKSAFADMGSLSKGDAALLRFAAAAEILESDFWVQYNELGGIQDKEVSGGTGNPIYTAKLKNLDGDFDQYIHDNTDDEITHFTFLNKYLESKGAAAISVFEQQNADHYKENPRIATVEGARTSFFSPELDRFYLAVRRQGSQPAAIEVFAPTQ
jgi:hypothetical protein